MKQKTNQIIISSENCIFIFYRLRFYQLFIFIIVWFAYVSGVFDQSKRQYLSMQEDQSSKDKAASRIQAMVRGAITRAKVKKIVTDFFKRKMIIKELLDTEESYIRDLSIIISDYQTPLISRKLITKQESGTIFMNVDQIRRLNELFFATIFEEARNYWHYQKTFEKVEKEIHFFKIYFEYFNHFSQSSTTLNRLMQKTAFADFINEARLNPAHKLLTLKDYLIKPVQRLPKYVLIMKQLKKRTPTDHPDYRNISRVLRLFEDVNESNNEKLNKVVNNYKLSQIQKKLIIPHAISQPGVEFVLQQPVTVIANDGRIAQGTLYLLNSEIIIARKNRNGEEKFLLSVPFKNGGGNIMTNQEHYFYKNTFTVQNGEGDSCTFVCPSEDQRQTLIQKIYNELMKAQQRSLEKYSALCAIKNKEGIQFLQKMSRQDLLPEVEILGTDERSDSMFKYTIYIVETRIKNIKHKIFVRFSELITLQEQLINECGLSLKNQLLKSTWLTNHKPKKIQERKMAIQRFLKEILSKQEIVERGQDVLLKLGLPADFYKLPQIYKDSESIIKKSVLYQRSTSDASDCDEKQAAFQKSIVGKKGRASIFAAIQQLDIKQAEKDQARPRNRSRRISIQDILKANQLHLGHFTRYTQIMQSQHNKRETISIDILIPWIQNQKGFVKKTITLAKEQRVLALIEQLSNEIGLKYFKDFRIFLQREYAGRLLDDDQWLPKVLQQMKCGKYLLIFRKMIYVSTQIQQHQIRKDRVRLRIIASQVIYDCKKDKYPIDYRTILRLAILVGISQKFNDEQEFSEQELLNQLKDGGLALRTREMIINSWTSFYDSDNTWKTDYQRNFPLLLKKLQSVGQRNSQIFRTSGIHDNEKEYNTTQVGQLAAISIILQMRSNPFFGSISFMVQISQWFRQYLIKFGEEDEEDYDNRNCWLIVKYNQLLVYSISLNVCYFSITYEELYKIEPYPSSILFHLRDREIDFLKLKTVNSYSIRQLLLYYKNYNEIVKKMDEDEYFEESMIQLVKQHTRQSTMRYNTCQ